MPFAGGLRSTVAGAGRQRLAPVCLALPVVLALVTWASFARADCGADRIDDRAPVSLVHDGDTLVLADGRRLRLIGINTPELAREGRPAEPGAFAARDRLRRILFTNGQRVQLRFDRERNDRYGRLLAHAFLDDGRNIAELLLAEGAGVPIAIPPNLWQVDCYYAAGDNARSGRLGVWALPAYQARPVSELNLRSEGFRVVRGRVTHISQSPSAVWINLDHNFALRIERADVPHFQGIDLQRFVGSEIEARGWIYARKGQLRMPLRHPAMLRRIDDPIPAQPASPLH